MCQKTPVVCFVLHEPVFNMGINPGMPKDELHNALADSYEQAKAVQRIFSELGVRPPFENKK